MNKKINPDAPLLVTVCGFSGSGKSTLAAALAAAIPGALFIDSDRTRKELFGIPMTQRLPQEAYTLEFTDKMVAEIHRRIGAHIAAGQAVVQSALLVTPDQRRQPELLAEKLGARFRGIWLEADAKILADRVAKRRNDASDATVAFLEEQLKVPPGAIDWPVIDSTQPPEAVLRQALALLSRG